MLFYASWIDEKDDKKVMEMAKRFIEKSIKMARKMDAENGYMYMPYSSPYQNVIQGYGEDNVKKLQVVAEKYDPTGVFQQLQPGYFELDGAPFGDIL